MIFDKGKKHTLLDLYTMASGEPSDINEHMKTLFNYAIPCDHITEFGTREGNSTIAFLFSSPLNLVSYDLNECPNAEVFCMAKDVNTRHEFVKADTREVDIDETDILFIDSEHTYDCISKELKRSGNQARKYIMIHDTELFRDKGERDQPGIWPAIQEFLEANKHWRIKDHFTNNNGLTVLARD